MLKRKVFYGGFNKQVSEKLYEKVKYSIANNSQNFYYIFPNGKLLTSYRKRVLDDMEVFMDLKLFTFDDVVEDLIDEDLRIEIDDSFKLLIIKKLLEDIDLNEFKKISSYPGFIKVISNIIGNIKRSLIKADEFSEYANNYGGVFKEVGRVYKAYEDFLSRNNLIDREGGYLLAIDKLKTKIDIFNNIENIIIDEFYDFRPIELKLIEEIAKLNINIFINIPFKKSKDLEIIKDTLDSLSSMGFEIVKDSEAKGGIEEVFYLDTGNTINKNKEVTILSASKERLEMKRVFQIIKENINKGIKPKEILLVPINDAYKELVYEIAQEEGVFLTKARTQPLVDTRLIGEILSILHLAIKPDKPAILNRVKSRFFGINNLEDGLNIYTYLKELDFKNLYEIDNLYNTSKKFNSRKEEVEGIYKVINILKKEVEGFKEKDLISNYNKSIKDLIHEYNIYEKFIGKIDEDESRFFDSMKIISSLDKVLVEIEGYSKIVGEISLEAYYEFLLDKLEQEKINLVETREDGIDLLDLVDIRGLEYKLGFILGLSHNNYPDLGDENFFINEKNYNKLKSIGVDIKDYNYRLENEIMKFSSALAVIENIYLTYTTGLENQAIPSIFIDEVKRVNPNYREDKVDFTYMIKTRSEDITTYDELAYYIIDGDYKNREIEEEYIKYYNKNFSHKLEEVNKKILGDYSRKNINSVYNGNLSEDKNLVKELEINYKNRIYSPSYLEDYIICPYRFFLKNIGKIDESNIGTGEYNLIIIGNIFHKVLKDFYTSHKDNINMRLEKNLEFNKEDWKYKLIDLVEKYGLENNFNLEDKSHRLILQDIYNRLENFIVMDLDRLKDHSLYVAGLEEEFGYSKYFFIEKNGRKIYLGGIIDRIDRDTKGRPIIIDYKSSRQARGGIDYIKSGEALQIPIYLLSKREEAPVAAMYGILKDNKYDIALAILGETSLVSKRNKGGLESREDLESILNNLEDLIFKIDGEINSGKFPVEPLYCPRFCSYREICRLEEVGERIDEIK